MKYFVRAFKYLISLCVVYLGIVYLMAFTGMSHIPPTETLSMLIHSQRGLIMVIAILALSFSYPVFGFMRKEISGNIKLHREQIIGSFSFQGYSLKCEEDGVMIFRVDNFFKRVTFLFEDEVSVSQVGDKLVVEGIRRGVAYVIYRLEGAIDRAE
ncbi:MAG: hypothetical protein SNH28_08825 [Rikenellaceae bacterium]